jgi:hypothetical protein
MTRLLGPLVLLAALAPGCASGPRESGIRLGDETLGQFRPGEATEDWVVAVIGPPTSRTDLPPDDAGVRISILRYTAKEEGSGLGGLFGLGGSKTTATVYFVVRDGLVTQLWADREQQRTLTGQKPNESGEKSSG